MWNADKIGTSSPAWVGQQKAKGAGERAVGDVEGTYDGGKDEGSWVASRQI